jgi:Fe(3+) dicitrate transport protein
MRRKALDDKKRNAVMTWRMNGLRRLLCASFTIGVWLTAGGSWGQTDSARVEIAPQELDRALALFAEQTNLQVLYAADLVRGLSTQGVSDAATPHDALRQLLGGTGLAYTFVETRTIAIHKAADTAHPGEIGGPVAGAAESKSKRVKLPEVVVKDVREREDRSEDLDIEQLKEIAGTVNVVTKEEIQLARPKNASEILRRVPGVNILEEYGQGLRPNIGIRGMNPTRSRNILVLVDGMPIQPALFGDPAMYYMIPIDRVDHIDVIKGGATVLYSPNTQGGLINFITKSVPLTPTFSTTNTFGSFNLFQSNNYYGGRFGSLGAQIGYMRQQSDGFRQHSASQVDDFALRLESNLVEKTQIRTNVYWFNDTAQTPGAISPAQYATDRTKAGKLFDEFKGQRGAIDITAAREIDIHNTVKLMVYGNVFERNWYIQDQNATTGALLPTSTNFLRKFNVFGVVPQHQFNFSLLGQDHKVVTGVRYHAERLSDVTGLGTAGSKISRTTNNADLETVAYSAYTEGEFRFTDALSITPGIRFEQVNQSRESMNAIPPATVPNFKGSANTQGLIYGTGVKYQLPLNTLLFGHVHTTYRPPTFANAIDPTTGTDRDLSAERGLSSDVGVRSTLYPGVSAEVAVFRMEFSNQIVQNGSQFVNGGKTLTEGIETSLMLDWGRLWKPLEGLASRANVTVLRPKSLSGTTNGKDLPLAPRMTTYGSIGYYHPHGASIELDGVFVGRQFSDVNNTTPENSLGSVGAIPAYAIFNLRLNYSPQKSRWSVFAGIRNLFDEKFIAQRTTASFVGILPGEIRNFYGGIAMKF